MGAVEALGLAVTRGDPAGMHRVLVEHPELRHSLDRPGQWCATAPR